MPKTYLIIDDGSSDVRGPDYVEYILDQDYKANANTNLIEIPHDQIEMAVNDGMSCVTAANGDKYYYARSVGGGKWAAVFTALLVLLAIFFMLGGCGLL